MTEWRDDVYRMKIPEEAESDVSEVTVNFQAALPVVSKGPETKNLYLKESFILSGLEEGVHTTVAVAVA